MKRRRFNGPRFYPLPRWRVMRLKQIGCWFEEFRVRHAQPWIARAMTRTVQARAAAGTLGKWYGKHPSRSLYRPTR